jgi:PAS domain S-box-containing protein
MQLGGESELRTARAALADSEERFRLFIEFTYDWEYWISPEGEYLYVSPACERISGYGPEEFRRDPQLLTSLVHGEDQELFASHLQTDLGKSDDTMELEFRIVNKQGEERWLAHVCQPVYAQDGRYLGWRASNRDITDRKEREAELLKAQRLESIAFLAGGIAHDFNNILTAVLGNIELAKMLLPPTDRAFERLSIAQAASTRARVITQQLLTFAKGGAPSKKWTSLERLIREPVELVLSGSNVKGKFSFPADLRLAEVDENQINQVLSNLVINAVQAMPEGGIIRVAAGNEKIGRGNSYDLAAGNYIRIDIADEGGGIPEKLHGKIFDPYFTTKESGSGLGLAASYSIVKRHGGAITFDSSPGKGSIFSLLLPASEETAIFREIPKEKEIHWGSGRILVMDDEEIVNVIAKDLLENLGYRVDAVGDGAETVAAYRQALTTGEPYAAVITDLTVAGGMGGKETVRRLLEIDREAKVIVSSGYANDPVMINYSEYGFKGVIPKPYKLAELGNVLWEVIEGRKVSQGKPRN